MLTDEQAAETIGVHRENLKYLRVHGKDLAQKYAGKYLVIYDQSVKHVLNSPLEISDLVETLTERQRATAVIRYISAEDEVFII